MVGAEYEYNVESPAMPLASVSHADPSQLYPLKSPAELPLINPHPPVMHPIDEASSHVWFTQKFPVAFRILSGAGGCAIVPPAMVNITTTASINRLISLPPEPRCDDSL